MSAGRPRTPAMGRGPGLVGVRQLDRVKKFPRGEFGMPCLLALKRLPEGSGHDKLALDDILRDHGIAS